MKTTIGPYENNSVTKTGETSGRVPSRFARLSSSPRGPWARCRSALATQEVGLLGVIVALGLCLSLVNSRFIGLTNIYAIVNAMVIIGLCAIGETFVLIAYEIDLSVGSVLGFAGMLAAWLMSAGAGPVIGSLVGVLAAGLFGLLQGVVVVFGKVNSFIVTLGGLSIALGFTELISGDLPIMVPKGFTVIGQGTIPSGMPIAILVLVGFVIIAQVVLARSVFGQRTIALGDNREAARLGGVPVRATRLLVFVVSGVMAGIAGIVFTSQVGVAEAQAGDTVLLTVIAAAVIGGASLNGGRGSMIGAFVGALLLGTIDNAFILLNLSAFFQDLATGVIIIVAVLFDQLRQGSFGRRRLGEMILRKDPPPEGATMATRGDGRRIDQRDGKVPQ